VTPPHWLSALFATHKAFAADVTFGPWRGVAADARPCSRPYLDAFFSRVGPAASGLTDERYGCGNSMMTRATALIGHAPFDPAHNEIGGEDDRLYQALDAKGARFAWAAEAWVYEHAPAHRCRVTYALRRAYSFGQTPASEAAHRRDWAGVVRWMAIGAGQAVVYGLLAAFMWLADTDGKLAMTDKAVRGLGKLVWWVTPKFYGQAEVRRTQRAAPGRTRRSAVAAGAAANGNHGAATQGGVTAPAS
jgi:hypothetical protein